MDRTSEKPTGSRRVGWWILVVVSALVLLNGVTWFFMGPGAMVSYTAETSGMSAEVYEQTFPEAAAHQARNTRQVAVWWAAFGAMALIVSIEGLRHGTRWAWNAMWAEPAALIGIGLVYTFGVGQLAIDNIGFGSIGVVALIGQILARPWAKGRGVE
jgi:hypothetical protein